LIGRTLAHYKITKSLGKGGMGEVYRATDIRLGREVALKMLSADLAIDPESVARFRREAKAIAALNHPNIVTIYSIDEARGHWFLTMELVEGDTVAELIHEPLPITRFMEIAVSLSDAVAAAHERGVIHRDLKPSNIMITGEGRVKVLDFGLAKLEVESTARAASLADTEPATATGSVFGTIPYMSPEQLQGRPADEQSDVFSLGVVLFEMATGSHPFQGRTAAERASAILRDSPPLASDLQKHLPRDAAIVIDACLQKAPGKRPKAREVGKALTKRSAVAAEDIPRSHSVAVLSFADLSQERDQEYLCDGLADELMNALTKIEGLKVASRTSCLQFKGVAGDIREIGRRIGVDTIVEGSIRKTGDRLRINAQLTKVEDGYQLWAERYDRELKDVFAIQEEIAQRIVAAFEITLSPRERRALQSVQTSNPRAYEFYLRGRQYQHRLDRRSLEFGRDMFQHAIDTDPNYARAYCGVADCSSYLFMLHDPSDEHRKAVAEASRKALELDPQLAEAHVSRGQAFLVAGDYASADAEFEIAIRLDPRLFEGYYFYGRSAFAQGDMDRAGDMFAKATELKPDDFQALSLNALVHKSRGERQMHIEKYGQAVERIRAHLALNPDDVRARYFGATALIEIGEREEGLRWARRALAMDPEDAHVRYNVACAFARAGLGAEAIDCLEHSLESFRASDFYANWIRNDPDFEPLRGDPRFENLMKRLLE
jgi:serine/threonine protein kinase/tetratricopeptide (TPR) repeat protein